jgi:hypothetical protein
MHRRHQQQQQCEEEWKGVQTSLKRVVREVALPSYSLWFLLSVS